MRGTIYNNGGYQVEVAPDGAIQVRPGDWLRKYSRAAGASPSQRNDE